MANTRLIGDVYHTSFHESGIDPAILATKMDKVTGATPGNIAVLDSGGEANDSGINADALKTGVDNNTEDIEAIKAGIDELGDAHAKSLDLDELPKVCHYEMFIIRNYAPDVTPDLIGQIWIDTAAGKVYMATATTNASSYKALN